MPADLTREEITHWRDFIVNLDPPDDVDVLLRIMDAARRSLSEPTRLAAARTEGYREGVEAIATALRREIPTGDGSTRSLTWSEALDAVDAIRAISPPPAEPSAPVAEGDPITSLRAEVDEQARAYGADAYFPTSTGVMLTVLRRLAALEAENAALKARNAKLVEGLRPFAEEADEWEGCGTRADDVDPVFIGPDDVMDTGRACFTVGDLRRARALVQGGPDAE